MLKKFCRGTDKEWNLIIKRFRITIRERDRKNGKYGVIMSEYRKNVIDYKMITGCRPG